MRRKVGQSVSGKLLSASAFVALMILSPLARAESMAEALALAYTNNPTLNAARAQTRAVDENVPIAKSGMRPFIEGTADVSSVWQETSTPGRVQQVVGFNANPNPGGPAYIPQYASFPIPRTTSHLQPYGFGLTLSQALFDGFRTRNNVESAQSAIFASRETLRNTEQNVLFDAASAYMDVIRDTAVVGYRQKALGFLEEQVRSERTRFDVGESTRTDVAQAESSRALNQSLYEAAKAQLQTSIAVYRQIIGADPKNLKAPAGVGKLLPGQIDRALDIAFGEHPAIMATKYLVDQADWDVKSAESELLPRLDLQASTSTRFSSRISGDQTEERSIGARLTVPIYQGGRVSATVRQNKEVLGQRWIEVDETVDSVRAAVVSAYGQLQAARASIEANRAQVRAADLALQGTIEERAVGQRTALDVLESQQAVLNAQILLATSERDAIVASYAVLSAIGRLSSDQLKLAVVRYNAEDHYLAVKDKWFGLRTPDGR
jgi:outer membrane protein